LKLCHFKKIISIKYYLDFFFYPIFLHVFSVMKLKSPVITLTGQ
jgi:hypothetical protein